MLVHKSSNFSIFFGDLQNSPFKIKALRECKQKSKNHLTQKIKQEIPNLQKYIKIDNLYFLHQVHDAYGTIIYPTSNIKTDDSLIIDGDFIISSKQNVGIGILTADCLPIVFYDIINNVVAIAHAGWRGTVKNIAKVVIDQCSKNFGSKPKDFLIFFGPSAKPCCYQVDEIFGDSIGSAFLHTLIKKNGKIYFDLPLYNQTLIENCGVKKENINLEYNICTICNTDFCSYRRDKENSGLEMSIITLN